MYELIVAAILICIIVYYDRTMNKQIPPDQWKDYLPRIKLIPTINSHKEKEEENVL